MNCGIKSGSQVYVRVPIAVVRVRLHVEFAQSTLFVVKRLLFSI